MISQALNCKAWLKVLKVVYIRRNQKMEYFEKSKMKLKFRTLSAILSLMRFMNS